MPWTQPTTIQQPPSLTQDLQQATLKAGQDLRAAAWKAGVLAAINVAVRILSARMIVLVAVVGAIALTWIALHGSADYRQLIALGVYCGFVVVPAVVLAAIAK